jgi:glycosyltransferase involved in cell wall biosynthesis
MASVGLFNNFIRTGSQEYSLLPKQSKLHSYHVIPAGRFQANPYGKTFHISALDLIKRCLMSMKLWFAWKQYYVIIIDSATTGLLLGCISLVLGKWRHKLVVLSFNVPRRRSGLFLKLSRMAFGAIDYCYVHSRYDIQLAKELYHFEDHQIGFRVFVREEPADGVLSIPGPFDDDRPYIISFGSNGRDYPTFFKAIAKVGIPTVVVAREWNLRGLEIPSNVRVLYNIPLAECDKLVRRSRLAVFTYDGSEPSCGQISMVTACMVGKPVICTDWIGAHDYILDGVNGLYVRMKDSEDLAEKITRLWNDNDLYGNLSAGAIRWAKEHASVEVQQRMIDDLVTTLVSDKT